MQIRAFYAEERTPAEIARRAKEMERIGFQIRIEGKDARGRTLLLFLESVVREVPGRQDGARSEKPRLAG